MKMSNPTKAIVRSKMSKFYYVNAKFHNKFPKRFETSSMCKKDKTLRESRKTVDGLAIERTPMIK